MNVSSHKCRLDSIEQFLSGAISREKLADLETHLNDCAQCKATLLESTASPQMWRDTRAFLKDVEFAGSGQIPHGDDDDDFESEACGAANGLDAVVRAMLGPTDNPAMLGRLGGYEVSGVVGRGGMAIVLKARDVSLDRFVAIKVLDPAIAHSSAARRRFVREAQAAAAVIHDNVISIFGVDHSGNHPFLVMPYAKGESLQQRIDRSGPLGDEDILNIALQIARGLAAAHDQGLVHRDIKPANILMPAGVSRILLTDFGLARAADDASLTRSGVIAGTPQYMSPEQITGQPVDGRADLFSLGSVMYAMACGHPPFRADTPYAVLKRIVEQPHRSISHVRADSPRYLVEILDRLLEKDPLRRFQSAEALADHLEHCLAHIRQPTLTDLPRLAKPESRWSARAVFCSAIFGGAILSGTSTILAAGVLAVWLIVGMVGQTTSSLKNHAPVDPVIVDPVLEPSAMIDDDMTGEHWIEEPELSSLEAELDVIWKSFEENFEEPFELEK